MADKRAVELAKKIVELDLLRDEIWEDFAELTGDEAYELLRYIQNNAL